MPEFSTLFILGPNSDCCHYSPKTGSCFYLSKYLDHTPEFLLLVGPATSHKPANFVFTIVSCKYST